MLLYPLSQTETIIYLHYCPYSSVIHKYFSNIFLIVFVIDFEHISNKPALELT